uniref:SFRICE_003303 n=1 Tax=Spodoptera frugiperda TaxID=7108 RepID=A0A2H1V229_SPOFR
MYTAHAEGGDGIPVSLTWSLLPTISLRIPQYVPPCPPQVFTVMTPERFLSANQKQETTEAPMSAPLEPLLKDLLQGQRAQPSIATRYTGVYSQFSIGSHSSILEETADDVIASQKVFVLHLLE